MKPPFRDRYGVLHLEDKTKPRNERFDREVEEKVARSAGVGGWAKGPVFIIEQAAEEPVDVPSWLTGLGEFPKPPGLDARLEEIHQDAADLWKKIEALKGMYE
jgi:hypothetical protein